MTTIDRWYEASAIRAATSCSIILFRYAAQNMFLKLMKSKFKLRGIFFSLVLSVYEIKINM
jgi:hypothetical protein